MIPSNRKSILSDDITWRRCPCLVSFGYRFGTFFYACVLKILVHHAQFHAQKMVHFSRKEKKEWREIHDILRVQGFNWLANGKDSCWIKIA
jgi:hypothetical protein